ncbi:MAG: glycogen/starch synthase, partial [Clostridia bacterium]
PEILEKVFGISSYHTGLMYYGECINLMKAAIECCDKIVTVSKTYAQEILNPYFAFGLDSILRDRQYKLCGIVNGIDTDTFNPETDKYLYKNYSFKTRNFKFLNKKGLQEEMGLPIRSDVPFIGMVTRLTSQKGLDLFRPIMHELLAKDVQFIVLGSGDSGYEEFMRHFEYKYHDKMRAYIGFNPEVASKIYGSCDMFLMPSKSEPCGLAQMIALRYGTIPIVNAVGGLRDTVIPYNPIDKSGNGINFQTYNSYDMLDAINRALDIYYNKDDFAAIKKNAMSGDYSWSKAVLEYMAVYHNL